MTLTRPTNEQLLADIRRRLDQGYAKATAERVKSIAKDATDVDLLRGMAEALADAIIAPKRRNPGRPRKSSKPAFDGVFNLDEMPALTAEEARADFKAMVRERGICEKIYTTHKKRGTPIATLCQRNGIGTDTYYKWFPANS